MKGGILHLRDDHPQGLANVERIYSVFPYPCVEDITSLFDYDDNCIEWMYHCMRDNPRSFREWREELADFWDFVAEHTADDLDRMQREGCEKRNYRLLIRARGGF
jgi:hypothetical protein